jgi:hypothetical protein
MELHHHAETETVGQTDVTICSSYFAEAPYSGLVPDRYVRLARDLVHFPDDGAIAALREVGVTHVFVHDRALRARTDDETADAVRHAPDLRLVAVDGDVSLYELRQR